MNYINQEKSKRKKRSCDDKEKQKAISIESTQEDNIKPDHGCKIRMLVGYGESEKLNATIITTKEGLSVLVSWKEQSDKRLQTHQRQLLLG